MKNKKKPLDFLYPIILALASPLSLYFNNLSEVVFLKIARTLAILSVITLLVFLFHWLVLKKADSARIVTSLIMLLLVNSGMLVPAIQTSHVNSMPISAVWIVIGSMIALVLVTVWLTSKFAAFRRSTDQFLGYCALILVILIPLSALQNFKSAVLTAWEQKKNDHSQVQITQSQELPDIYFIILDGYTNSRTLQSRFEFDNSAFEKELKQLGFFIPEKSYSNYDGTALSLSSIFNMQWVQSFTTEDEYDPGHTITTQKAIHNDVRDYLANQGYSIVAFTSEYPWLLWRDADELLEPAKKSFLLAGMNQYEYFVLRQSMVNLLIGGDVSYLDVLLYWSDRFAQDKYVEQVFLIEELSEIHEKDQPKFIYAHSSITHYPYLFHADGSIISLADQGSVREDCFKENIRGSYLETIRYVNVKLIPELTEILQMDSDAIIIIQGDHGYPGDEQNSIFFPIHDPKNSLADQKCFTPVNLFSRIFNTWFGTNYPNLPDKIYRTTSQDYYQFEYLGVCQEQP